MTRLNAARRVNVWINSDIRKTPEFDAISSPAFGLWTLLPFLVDERHALPDVAVIACDGDITLDEAMGLVEELVAAGFIETLDDGARLMTPLSRQFYSFTDPEGGEADA